MNTTEMHGPHVRHATPIEPKPIEPTLEERAAAIPQHSEEWKKSHPKPSARVLLTGAGGAIGVHMLAHIMHNTDWDVVALDSFRAEHKGHFDRISEVCKDHPDWKERIMILQHDLRAPISPREIKRIGDIDYIVNLASRSDVPNSLEEMADQPTGASAEFVRNNVDIMLHMLDYARVAMPSVFLQFSTDEVYGPTPKDSGGHKEWDATLPSNAYAASKAAQEALGIAWWRSYGVPLIITNTMNNFGEMQAPSKFPAMIQRRIERGEPIDVHVGSEGEIGTRYYLHSRNAADAVIFILKNVEAKHHAPGEIDRPVRLNIVGDRQVSNKELVEVISGLMEKPAKIREVKFHERNPGHDLHYGLNGGAMKKLGWSSPVPFEESMKRTIDWQKEHPEWMQQ